MSIFIKSELEQNINNVCMVCYALLRIMFPFFSREFQFENYDALWLHNSISMNNLFIIT